MKLIMKLKNLLICNRIKNLQINDIDNFEFTEKYQQNSINLKGNSKFFIKNKIEIFNSNYKDKINKIINDNTIKDIFNMTDEILLNKNESYYDIKDIRHEEILKSKEINRKLKINEYLKIKSKIGNY